MTLESKWSDEQIDFTMILVLFFFFYFCTMSSPFGAGIMSQSSILKVFLEFLTFGRQSKQFPILFENNRGKLKRDMYGKVEPIRENLSFPYNSS